MAVKFIVQLDTSISGDGALWVDEVEDTNEGEARKAYDFYVHEYPHRQVRLIERVTSEQVVSRNFI